MSTVTIQEVILTPEEYIEGEQHSEVRHEYYAGRVEAMAGASTAHNQITGNFHIELGIHLRGKPCQPFVADMKVHIQSADEHWFYYPDVLVSCDPAGQHKYYCDTPSVIIEVLSEATEHKDRREKFFAFTTIRSLHTYILAAQDKREVTVFHRTTGDWSRTVLTGDATLSIPELEFTISLDALYARTGL
jgi:Uma2 family endonuclease